MDHSGTTRIPHVSVLTPGNKLVAFFKGPKEVANFLEECEKYTSLKP